MIELPAAHTVEYRRVLVGVGITGLVRTYIEVFEVAVALCAEYGARETALCRHRDIEFENAVLQLDIRQCGSAAPQLERIPVEVRKDFGFRGLDAPALVIKRHFFGRRHLHHGLAR